jgi:hypothetical protein
MKAELVTSVNRELVPVPPRSEVLPRQVAALLRMARPKQWIALPG